ncbi:MAG: phosphoenolpyruvate--protein phosphotransferase [bacterium]
MVFQQDSLKTLSNIARILQKSHPSENPLAHIVTIVRDQIGVDVCSLYLLQEKTLVLVATDGLDPASVGQVRMRVSEGLTGLAVEKLQPVIVNEASRHPRFKYFPKTGEEKFSSFAAVPLLDRDQVIGVLTLQTAQAREFSPHEIEILKLIAFQLSGVVQNLVRLEVLQQEGKSEKRPQQLSGIPVAPGFGIAAAFFLRPGVSPVVLPFDRTTKLSPKEEWKKLKTAMDKASKDLARLEKKLQKKFSKKESDIFYSHRMILSDPSFQKKLKTEVQKGKSAFDTVGQVIGDYIRHFEKVEDPHFRERAADLEDLRQRVLEHLVGTKVARSKQKLEGILIAETLVPSDTARLDPELIKGIVTSRGGLTSHAAILARSLGIPAVMGIGGVVNKIQPGDLLIVDGNEGKVYVHPERPVLREYEKIQERYADRIVHLQKFAGEPAHTRDGERVHVEANVGLISDLKKLRYFGAEGVGLYRTEFPFMMRKRLPDEEEQFVLYRKVVEEAGGLPITFRILDAGGDKPVEALGMTPEANPFLGYRSIRLFLNRPEILEIQFRALLRASLVGPVLVLVPMISGLEELRAIRDIFKGAQQNLKRRQIEFDAKVPFGIMIEVPSAVQMVRRFAPEVDFFSIGTNDLTQYTLAVDRNNERVSSFFEPLHPAVIQSIARVAKTGREFLKPVGVCGEMAGDPKMAPLLVGLGVTQLSMIPANIPLVKKVIREIDYAEVKQMAEKALEAGTVEEVRELLRPFGRYAES